MSAQLKPLSFADAFGSLLDFSHTPLSSKLPAMPTHEFGVQRHFTTVGNRMKRAMSVAAHEQALKQKAPNRSK